MKKEYGKRSDHEIEKLKDGVYRIDEFGADNCYLVLGSERALLIDTGTGYGDLLGAVRKITDLPLIVAATHAHTDHIGGMGQFERIYVHRDDICFFNRQSATRPVRKLFLMAQPEAKKRGFVTRDIKKPESKTRMEPMDDGFEFDLGGKTIKAVLLPGHTKGSVTFIDDADGCLFAGDNIAPSMWLFLPHATTVETWIESAEKLVELSEKYDIYWGHSDGKADTETMRRTLELGRELIGKKKNSLLPLIKAYPKLDFYNPTVIYKTNRVRNRKKTK